MERINKRQVVQAFIMLANKFGRPVLIDKKTLDKYRCENEFFMLPEILATSCHQIGAWELAEENGRFAIHEIENDQGGVSLPFGYRSKSAKDFYYFAHDSLELLRYQEKWSEGNKIFLNKKAT